jgi:hypothetical protein
MRTVRIGRNYVYYTKTSKRREFLELLRGCERFLSWLLSEHLLGEIYLTSHDPKTSSLTYVQESECFI